MWKFAILACLLVIVQAQDPPPYNGTCVSGTYPPDKSRLVPEYVVNLDLPPIQRWTEMAKAKKNEIKTVLVEFKKFLEEFGGWAKELIKLLDERGDKFDSRLPHPYRDEMKGLADAAGLNVGEIAFYNIFYEIFTVCTSIVAQDPSGKLYHGRNLDFGLFLGWDIKNRTWEITEVLRPTVVNINYQKGGKTVFKAVHFAGYVGVLTGVAPGKFTLSMDERFKADGGYLGILEWLETGKGTWMGFLTRQTMETAQNYQQAQNMLANTLMIAPAYFILGGTSPGQGSVITRNREVNGTDIWQMTDTSAGHWYILETNYDHWEKPFVLDNRRDPGNRCMQTKTQKNIGIAGLFDVLSSKPVLNKLTTYSALMQVDSGHLETWLQYCKDPCMPW